MLRRAARVSALLCLAVCSYVDAQTAETNDAQLQEAKRLVDRAKEAYQRGDYEQASQSYREAYRLRPSPLLWYNVGLAEEKRNECSLALRAYRRYLDELPAALNREDTEKRIGELADRQRRGLCKKTATRAPSKKPPAEAPPVAPPPAPAPTPDEPPAGPVPLAPPITLELPVVPASGRQPGLWPHALSFRFGALVGGFGDAVCERAAGLRMRLAFSNAIAKRENGQAVLHFEPFLSFAHFGYQAGCTLTAFDPILNRTTTLGTNLTGSFSSFATGAALRGSVFLSERHRLTLQPALGMGLSPVLAKLGFDHTDQLGRCDSSSLLLLPFINIDVLLRYELGHRSALTFSPMSLYIFFDSVSDGSPPLGCRSNQTPAKSFYRFSGATVHYGLDVGYAFQF